MKRIAVILTVFNRKQITLRCLNHLKDQTIHANPKIKIEIFLTNDGCTDGTPEAIQEQFPETNIINGDGNLFWNRGMYVAWTEAAKNDYDFYLWLNDDTLLEYDALERLIECSTDKNHQSIIIGSCCSSHDKNFVTYGGHSIDNKIIRNLEKESKCIIFHGNIVLIPKYVFKKIGFNDYHYRHALGDFDYSLMAYRKGVEAYVAKGIYGVCDLHKNRPKWCDYNIELAERWKAFHQPGGNGSNPFEFFYYRRKNFGLLPACLTFISNYIHVLFPKFWR